MLVSKFLDCQLDESGKYLLFLFVIYQYTDRFMYSNSMDLNEIDQNDENNIEWNSFIS